MFGHKRNASFDNAIKALLGEMKEKDAHAQRVRERQHLYAKTIDEKIKAIKEMNANISNEETQSVIWANFAENLLKEITYTVLQSHNLHKTDVTLCICGSLAKKQATPFSDLDCFMIVGDARHTPSVQAAMADLFIIFDEIFQATNQFCLDPVGINPKALCGTQVQLIEKIKSGDVFDKDAMIISMLSARSLFGEGLPALTSELKEQPASTPSALMQKYYRKAVKDFKGPRSKEKLNLKSDLFRPLDFIVSALRLERGLNAEDGSDLNTVNLAKKLLDAEKISKEVHDLIVEVFSDAMLLRFAKHIAAGTEDDDLLHDDPELRILLDKVAILRGIAKSRLDLLEKKTPVDQLPKFAIDDFFNPEYLDNTFSSDDMVFDLQPVAIELAGYYGKLHQRELANKYSRVAEDLERRKKLLQNIQALKGIAQKEGEIYPLLGANNLQEKLRPIIEKLEALLTAKPKVITRENIKILTDFSSLLVSLSEKASIDTVERLEVLANSPLIQSKLSEVTTPLVGLINKVLAGNAQLKFHANALDAIAPFHDRLKKEKPRDLLKIAERFEDSYEKTSNSGVTFSSNDKIGLVNVIQSIEMLRSYLSQHENARFSHSRQPTIKRITDRMETKLANEGQEAAVAYLFSKYHYFLTKKPNDESTRLMSQALCVALNIKTTKSAGIYNVHALIMQKVNYSNSSVGNIAALMEDYITDIEQGLSYKLSRQNTRKQIQAELSIVQDAIDQLQNNEPITNFNFPQELWSKIDKYNMFQSEMRGKLMKKLDLSIIELNDAHDNSRTQNPNMGLAIRTLLSDRGLIQRIQRGALPLSNAELAMVIQAIELSKRIVSNENKEVNRTALLALLERMEKSDLLKVHAKTFMVFYDPTIQKQKLIKKLNKKISGMGFHLFKSSADPKIKVLEQLRNYVVNPGPANVAVNDFTHVLEKWQDDEKYLDHDGRNLTNAELIHKHRNIFRSEDRPAEDKTETEEFLEKLSKKFGSVNLG